MLSNNCSSNSKFRSRDGVRRVTLILLFDPIPIVYIFMLNTFASSIAVSGEMAPDELTPSDKKIMILVLLLLSFNLFIDVAIPVPITVAAPVNSVVVILLICSIKALLSVVSGHIVRPLLQKTTTQILSPCLSRTKFFDNS